MRKFVDSANLEEFMNRLGARATTPGISYFTGGSTALLLGIRNRTIDIDIKLDPEPQGVFEAIAELKESLAVNVELASPDQFIPPLPGWRDRSIPIMTAGKVDFKHYDLYSQTLAKIERGHDRDLADARSFLARRLIDPAELERLFDAIRPQMIRYPALDPGDFARRLQEFLRTPKDDEAEKAPRPQSWGSGTLREEDLTDLPGAELILAGMKDLRGAEPTECALLVLIAAPRLRRSGLRVPERNDIARPYEHQLYALLERTHGETAYSRYNSLIRRVVSFSQTLEHHAKLARST